MKKPLLILTLLALVTVATAQYYDFSAVCETGQTLYYHILPNDHHEVVVTHPTNNTTNPWGGYTQPEGHLVIPESVEYDGVTYTVVSIGANAFDDCQNLSSVVFPNSIRRIETEAFWYCTGISSEVIIPDQCTFIGGYAFLGCSAMSSLTIGASVDTIQFSAFEDCIGLQSIYCHTPTPPFSEHIPTNPYYEDRSIFNNVPTDIPVFVNCVTFDQFLLNWDWSRFVNIEGVFLGAPTLSVGVNNPEYGTAEVVSIPEDCEHTTATVRATPNLGHVFGYWKRNGAVVSFAPEYTFTLDHDCVMTACFDGSAIVYDSMGYPDHVVGRKYNDAGQVTGEYPSDFVYSENGILTNYNFPGQVGCTYHFQRYPSMPSYIFCNYGGPPYLTESFVFHYNTFDQITYYSQTWNQVYDGGYGEYFYDGSHRLYQKRTTSDDDGYIQDYQYEYEDGNRTRIESLSVGYENNLRLYSITTNHYNARHQVVDLQTDIYNSSGVVASRTLKTYSYTAHHKTDSIVTQTFTDGHWTNSAVAHYVYDGKGRVVEYQTGTWSADNSIWDITKKTIYHFDDEAQVLTVTFLKKNADEWVWDVYSGQTVFYNNDMYEWQRSLRFYNNYSVNQLEISLHYMTYEVAFPRMSEWYYTLEWDDGTISYQHLEYTADTTINEERPKVIVRSNTQYDREEHTEVTHEYILEQNNKVYWWNKDLHEFTTLYDYNAQAGDEWEIKVGTESITVHVDSVGVFEYDGESRKMLHISDVGGLFDGDIVVGFGHMTSFFPEKLMHRDARYTVDGLRCYWVEDALLYHNGDEDCDAVYSEIHGVEEDGPSTPSTGSGTLVVYPNPANDALFVETHGRASQQAETYRITNVMGQTLMTGTINAVETWRAASLQRIDISGLPAGMYFITAGGQTVKFVKR